MELKIINFDVCKDLDVEITLVITFFLFQKILANPIEFVYPMSRISAPEIISFSFLVTLVVLNISKLNGT